MHLLHAEAWCSDCIWKTEGKNAMGNAARHHKKTLHFVQVELYFGQSFGIPPNPQLPELILQPKPTQSKPSDFSSMQSDKEKTNE